MATGVTQKYADGTDSGWIEITHANITGSINLRRIGNIVTIYASGLYLKNDFSSGYSVTIGEVPQDCCPHSQINIPAGNSSKSGIIRISNSGNIAFYKPSGTWAVSDTIHFCMTYIV